MAAKKAAGDSKAKTAAKRKPKKVAKVKAVPTYKTLGALKAAKKKGTAPRSITATMIAATIEFRVKVLRGALRLVSS